MTEFDVAQRRQWWRSGSNHTVDATDDLVTEDFVLTSGGSEIRGREEFKEWVRAFTT